VIRVEDPLPRAYVVAGARIATGDDALATVQDPGFDATREVILAEGAARRARSAGGQARVTRFANDRVRIEADLDGPGFVVLVDAYDPGWTAQVDGRPARVSCANLAFRAVEAASGRHVIEMTYRPRGLAWGAGLTVATIIGMLILAHPPSPPPSDRKRSSIVA